MKKQLDDFWFLSGLYLVVVAVLARIFDAYVLGNVFAAFIPDTFIGFPWFHVLFLSGFVLIIFK